MAMIIFGAQGFSRRAQRERTRLEAQRLRSALGVGLRALRNLHEDNLRVLAGARPPLMSGRHQMGLLRTQLGRLIVLDQPEIEAVLTASIAAEAAEAMMAVSGKPLAGVAFSAPKGDEDVGILQSSLERACAMLEAAETLLTGSGSGTSSGAGQTHDAPSAPLASRGVAADLHA
ncbi:MAG: hypothetical protein ABSH33_16005 [Steroidobacteraceae bacterium]|jgi:hypothetical protein